MPLEPGAALDDLLEAVETLATRRIGQAPPGVVTVVPIRVERLLLLVRSARALLQERQWLLEEIEALELLGRRPG